MFRVKSDIQPLSTLRRALVDVHDPATISAGTTIAGHLMVCTRWSGFEELANAREELLETATHVQQDNLEPSEGGPGQTPSIMLSWQSVLLQDCRRLN